MGDLRTADVLGGELGAEAEEHGAGGGVKATADLAQLTASNTG